MRKMTNEEILACFSDDQKRALMAERERVTARLAKLRAELDSAEDALDGLNEALNVWCDGVREDLASAALRADEYATDDTFPR